MQLIKQKKQDKKVNLKVALTAATAALFGASTPLANAATVDNEESWAFDTAFLYYSETDRVTASEAIIAATKTFKDDKILSLKLTIDALTGASANGAVAQPNVQTFTRPSGEGQYQTKAGEIPLDDTFRDTRVQLNAQWTQPIAENYTASIGGHLSKEFDYLSLGINGNLAVDFNNKNSTFSLGASVFQDTFEPEGGIPKPFYSMPSASGEHEDDDDENNGDDNDGVHDQSRLTDSDDKTTIDLMLGFTQVINRRMIMQFNYSYSMVDGYLTDPFKIVSVVDGNGIAQDYLYENRPDKRQKQSLFAQSKYHFETSILDVSYRYMWDDWEIDSHTIDTRLRFPLSNNSYIEPHVRFYQQTAAEFYQPFINESEVAPLPQFASADYRIGEMTTYTVGLKYGMILSGGNELSFRLEYYRQEPKSAGHNAPGALADVELYPGVDAVIAQVSYSF
jgi:hypothetical protein